jgi:hypothetical protein
VPCRSCPSETSLEHPLTGAADETYVRDGVSYSSAAWEPTTGCRSTTG